MLRLHFCYIFINGLEEEVWRETHMSCNDIEFWAMPLG